MPSLTPWQSHMLRRAWASRLCFRSHSSCALLSWAQCTIPLLVYLLLCSVSTSEDLGESVPCSISRTVSCPSRGFSHWLCLSHQSIGLVSLLISKSILIVAKPPTFRKKESLCCVSLICYSSSLERKMFKKKKGILAWVEAGAGGLSMGYSSLNQNFLPLAAGKWMFWCEEQEWDQRANQMLCHQSCLWELLLSFSPQGSIFFCNPEWAVQQNISTLLRKAITHLRCSLWFYLGLVMTTVCWFQATMQAKIYHSDHLLHLLVRQPDCSKSGHWQVGYKCTLC